MHRTTRRLSPSRILKRPRRLATTFALALGIVAVPTVALAVTTDALPGDPLKLGQENKIANATTTLIGTDAATGNNTLNGVLQVRRESGQGAALKVENNAPLAGTGRQGINIQVPAGQAPINANSDAGKSNLNVDKLDGRDEQDFLNASRAYKKSSGIITGTGGGSNTSILERCDTNDIAIGFSAIPHDKTDTISSISAHFGGYLVEFQDNVDPSQFSVEVICSDNAKPFEP